MQMAHDGDARSAFPFCAPAGHDAGMTVSALSARAPLLSVPRDAELRLRGRAGVLRASVSWPEPAERPPALVIFFPDPARDAGQLVRVLSRLGGVVVLAAHVRSAPSDPVSTAFDDASAVLGWVADHAEELDADPDRLVVAGEGAGAALAAAVALHARDEWWPAIARQVLIHPDLDAWQASVPYASSLRAAPLEGAPAATVVSDGAGGGRCLAARLREAGVELEELYCEGVEDADLLASLVRTLRAA
jgi:alpha/beta hydrolase fold